ncbi:putative signal peptidase I [Monocercomonoides exilis]|uniref:putative signal peptidase I n=1 Tax=Monocercomonoides exilis TaxID=2049356 RepID=UPI00355A32A1|nr:putative signal peptidase I [Monocercomonoides exilis]|eukprot:MONOS_9214.1-p1 / transcript=MONOS_9214.1 / gene=MONOS_9214 / organism=Monocercomonoides_exilis_PA203 / gene_product=signal peptidase I / transcript_product=signal peptidase I / location=Mono_scaffold00372:2882-3643(+) / protein_length=152 / sequence_SO=supercontig / SO=protein_coding / is_pseudo=false
MASAATKRIPGELAKALREQPDGIIIEADPSNIFKWNVTIAGPAGTPYAGGQFHMLVEFPPDYPFSPPKLTFTHKIYHPNVKKDGSHICADGLDQTDWKAGMKTLDLIILVYNLLKTPNPGHPVEEDIAMEFNEKPAQFAQTARQWTANYAK